MTAGNKWTTEFRTIHLHCASVCCGCENFILDCQNMTKSLSSVHYTSPISNHNNSQSTRPRTPTIKCGRNHKNNSKRSPSNCTFCENLFMRLINKHFHGIIKYLHIVYIGSSVENIYLMEEKKNGKILQSRRIIWIKHLRL